MHLRKVNLTPTESKRQLRGGTWKKWGREVRPPLTASKWAMTSLPQKAFYQFSGLDCHSCNFVTSRVENKKSACDSIVMTWVDDGEIRSPYVRRLKNLIRHVPPWLVAPTTAQRLNEKHSLYRLQSLAATVVEWYEVKYLNTALYNSPVVSRSFKP